MKHFQRSALLCMVTVCLIIVFPVNAQSVEQPLQHPPVDQMVWSPDGQFIASTGIDGLITIWDAETGESVQQVNEELSQRYRDSGLAYMYIVRSMTWGPNNELSVVGGGTVEIWNVSEGTRTASLAYPDTPEGQGIGSQADISKVVWTPDGTMLLLASTMTNFSFWDSQTYQFIKGQQSLTSFDLAMRSDGRLAVGGLRGAAVFPTYTESEYSLFLTTSDQRRVGDGVVVVRWSFNGSYLLGITSDGRTYIWDVTASSNQLVSLLRDIPHLSLSSETLFIDASDWTIIQAGGQIVRYDMTSSEIIQTAALAAEPLVAAWSPYGAQIAYIAANNPSVLRIETPLASLDELSRTLIRCDLEAETTALFSEYIASGNMDGIVQQLDVSPETQMPAACRQDLLAIADALLP